MKLITEPLIKNQYISKRRIEEVLDIETGEIIKSSIFFQNAEVQIILHRRNQQIAISNRVKPKFVCFYCHQTVRILGRETKRGKVSFFAHGYDSDACEIKTDSKYTKKEIEIIKYAAVRESERHILIKNTIAEILKTESCNDSNIKNVQVEKRVKSLNLHLNWRRPDVFVKYKEIEIALEIQLSTTFLSVIVERDIFYRLNKIFIIWIFNYSENQIYIDLSSLMCKDIYFANKRNAFIFDEEARLRSNQQHKLVLLCLWFEPLIIDDKFVEESSIRHEKYVTLDELNYDYVEYKPYYVDSDILFSKYQPDQYISRVNIELLEVERLKLGNYDYLHWDTDDEEIDHIVVSEEELKRTKDLICSGELKLSKISKGGKFGYETNNIIILDIIYDNASEFDLSGFAFALLDEKWSYIDTSGKEIISCAAEMPFPFQNGKSIAKIDKEWVCLNFLNKTSVSLNYNLELLSNNAFLIKYQKIEYPNGKFSKEFPFGIMNFEGKILSRIIYKRVFEFVGERAFIRSYKKLGAIDQFGNLVIDLLYQKIMPFRNELAIARLSNGWEYYGKWGCIDKFGKIKIPFIYNEFNSFKKGLAIVEDDFSRRGVINLDGIEVIPCKFNDIIKVNDLLFKVFQYPYCGFISNTGEIIIPCIYDEIADFNNNIAKASKDNLWGYIDSDGNDIIPCIYEMIESFHNGFAKVLRDGLYGYINIIGIEVIECLNDRIEIDSLENYNIFIGNKVGYIDKIFQIFIRPVFDFIGEFNCNILKVRNGKEYMISDLARCILNSKHYYVDKSGKVYQGGWK